MSDQTQATLATGIIDDDRIRIGLRNVIQATRGCRLEIIMKDNNTLGDKPENLLRWCQIAKEEADSAR
jgi:hypothetical protein